MNETLAITNRPQYLVRGPLGSVIPAYAALLSQQGYSQQSIHLHIRFLADMNRWAEQQGLHISDLTPSTIEGYMVSRHQRLLPRRDDASILRRLLELLYTQGLLPLPAPSTLDDPFVSIEDDFDRYLSRERGLSVSTRIIYRSFVRRFLSVQFSDKPVRFANLAAQDVIQFIQKQAPRLSPKRAGQMTTALRSFLHYLLHRGEIAADLAPCVPAVAHWSFSALPKFLQPSQVRQVLDQCDRQTPKGRRD